MKKTIKINKWYIIICPCIIILAVAIILQHQNTSVYKVDIYKADNGWGYDIKKAGETIIHQPFVPAVSKGKAFANKKMAKKAGSLVVKKIERGDLPSLTKEEIKKLGIFIENE